jgi:hypothetical protein
MGRSIFRGATKNTPDLSTGISQSPARQTGLLIWQRRGFPDFTSENLNSSSMNARRNARVARMGQLVSGGGERYQPRPKSTDLFDTDLDAVATALDLKGPKVCPRGG